MATESWDRIVARAVKRARKFSLPSAELARLEVDLRRSCEIAAALGCAPSQFRVAFESDRPGHCRMVSYSDVPVASVRTSEAVH